MVIWTVFFDHVVRGCGGHCCRRSIVWRSWLPLGEGRCDWCYLQWISTRRRKHESVLIGSSSENGLVEHVGEPSNERMFIRHLSMITRACMYAYMYVCIYGCVCIGMQCVYACTRLQIFPHTHTRTCIHSHMHVCVRARVCTCVHMYMRVYTCVSVMVVMMVVCVLYDGGGGGRERERERETDRYACGGRRRQRQRQYVRGAAQRQRDNRDPAPRLHIYL